MGKKIYIQCGYENKCKNKDCLKCNRRTRHNISLTLAEETIIENFSVCDLDTMRKEKPKELELWQDICTKIMIKVFKDKTPKGAGEMTNIIHLRISPENHQDVYLCNWASSMTKGKWTWNKGEVTCKNCLRILRKKPIVRQVKKYEIKKQEERKR